MEFIDLKAQYAALKPSIDARIARVLQHCQFILGPEVAEMEEKLAAWTVSKHCISVASGTDALLIALMALDVKPGDEVITTPFTFVATGEMIVLLGAKPVFVDIEPDTCNIDATKIEAKITKRTKAIMPVSLYGQPADMDAINAIAAKHRIPVIEDAAQSFGASYKGKKSCNLSTIGCTSFFPSKPLGCYGDGGAIFTNDDALAKAMKEIRVHGQSGRYNHTRIGIGGRMDTLQCAVILAKLERFDWELERREEAAQRYAKLLDPLAPALRRIAVRPDRTSVHGQYTILSKDRDRIAAQLKSAGIPTAVHYPLSLHQQPAYEAGHRGERYPGSEEAARCVLSLPMHADIATRDQNRIVGVLRETTLAAPQA